MRSRGVAFVGVSSQPTDSLADLDGFVRINRVTWPIWKDRDGKLAQQLGVRRTPEVLLFDGTGHLRYRGRIDNQYEPGIAKAAATSHDLRDALDDLLALRPIGKPLTEPAGCLLGRAERSTGSAAVVYTRHIAPDSAAKLPVLPSPRPDWAVSFDVLRRSRQLGPDDPRSSAIRSHAALACQPGPWPLRQRSSPERRRQAVDRDLGRQRLPGRQPSRFAAGADFSRRVEHSHARFRALHAAAVQRACGRSGGLSIHRSRSGLQGRPLDSGSRGSAGLPRCRASLQRSVEAANAEASRSLHGSRMDFPDGHNAGQATNPLAAGRRQALAGRLESGVRDSLCAQWRAPRWISRAWVWCLPTPSRSTRR